MQIPPLVNEVGWQVGGGRTDLSDKGVDFILSADKASHRIAANLFRLHHDPRSGLLLLTANSQISVYVDGKEVNDGASIVVSSKPSVMIAVGTLIYTMTWTVEDLDYYNEQVQQLRQRLNQPQLENLHMFTISPQTHHWEIAGFSVQGAFATGVTSTVSPAVHKSTQTVVACKRIVRSNESKRNFTKQEVDSLTWTNNHVSCTSSTRNSELSNI